MGVHVSMWYLVRQGPVLDVGVTVVLARPSPSRAGGAWGGGQCKHYKHDTWAVQWQYKRYKKAVQSHEDHCQSKQLEAAA